MKKWLFIFAICLLATITGFAQSRDQIFVGARPMAMGETFVAIADDGNAVYWNPAGLPYIDYYIVNSMYANLFQTGVANNYLSLQGPVSDRLALGFDWFNIGFDDEELGFARNKFSLSAALKVHNKLSFGANLKRISTNISLDGFTLGKASGWGMDVGLLYSPFDRLKFGIMAHDLTDTKVKYEDTRSSDTLLKRNIRLGASYQFKNALFGVDVDDRVHFGAEYWFKNIIAARGGLQKDLHLDDGLTYSFGAGLRYKLFQFDYAYTISPTLDNTQRFSFSLFLDVNPSLVSIKNVRINNAFASLYKSYENNSIGTVNLYNESEETLECRLRVATPNNVGSYTTDVVLRPLDTKEVPLNMTWSDEVMLLADDVPVRSNVEVSYESKNRTKTERDETNFYLFRKGALSWANGTDQAAAFITSDDEIVDHFASTVTQQFQDSKLPINSHIAKAMQIFDALGTYGIAYTSDPNTPYSTTSISEVKIDNVLYPRELLKRKTGDCDDTSILYAALLENQGIHTALVDVPGHLFMMFDTGIHERNRLLLSVDESQYVLRDHHVWLAVETTKLREPFCQAWLTGAEEYAQWQEMNKLNVVDTHSAWRKYQSAISDEATVDLIAAPARSRIEELYVNDLSLLLNLQEHHFKEYYIKPLSDDSLDISRRNELVVYYAQTGQMDQALVESDRLLHQVEKIAAIYNNRANLYFQSATAASVLDSSKLDSATVFYTKARELDPDDGGITLNLAIAQLIAGIETKADTLFEIALQQCETSFDKAIYLLGFDTSYADPDTREKITEATKQELLARIELASLKAKVKKADEKKKKEIREKMKKISTRLGGAKRVDANQVKSYLYWKY